MSGKFVSVRPEATVAECAVTMKKRSSGAVVVTDDGRPIGILTARELVDRVIAEGKDPTETCIESVMTRDPTTVRLNDDLEAVFATFRRVSAQYLPVVSEEGSIVGLVSLDDVLSVRERITRWAEEQKTALVDSYAECLAKEHDERVPDLIDENQRLQDVVLTDELTGLSNDRYFQRRIQEELCRCKQYDRCLSLVLCDIDGFEQINEQHGHASGDRILRTLASLFTNTLDAPCASGSFRESDVVVRYGGEEFALLLPETNPGGALKAAERIRTAVRDYRFRGALDEPIHVTMTFGIAGFPEQAQSTDQLIQRAGEALKQAKLGGRDRCSIYETGLEAVLTS